MRVVGGQARGRRLVAPPGRDTRPTSDRAREAIFNSLRSIDALVDARVADLFAGSGALGIEALSRGARRACSSSATGAAAVIEQNLADTGLSGGSVVRADVMRWLAGRGSTRGTSCLLTLRMPSTSGPRSWRASTRRWS